jgi:hypothetical protein
VVDDKNAKGGKMIVDTSGYLGFTYNGKHSSEFNIVRVSDGSRFN